MLGIAKIHYGVSWDYFSIFNNFQNSGTWRFSGTSALYLSILQVYTNANKVKLGVLSAKTYYTEYSLSQN